MIEGLALLQPYLPEGSLELASRWLSVPSLTVKLVSRGNYRLGTYSYRSNGRQSIILNTKQDRYSFLITMAHEVAHMQARQQWGLKIAPHGPEWQLICRRLLLEAAEIPSLPEDIRQAMHLVAAAPKSTHLANKTAARIFMQYSEKYDGMTLLADLPTGSRFVLDDGRVFLKGEKNRTRYKCMLQGTSKYYLIGGSMPVKRVA